MSKEKPFILQIESAKVELLEAINKIMTEKNIPCYFMEPLVADIRNSLAIEARKEIQALSADYEKTEVNDNDD